MVSRSPSLFEQVLLDRAAQKMAEFDDHPELLKRELRAPVEHYRERCMRCGADLLSVRTRRNGRCDRCSARKSKAK